MLISNCQLGEWAAVIDVCFGFYASVSSISNAIFAVGSSFKLLSRGDFSGDWPKECLF